MLVKLDVAAFGPPQFLQLLAKCPKVRLNFRVACGVWHQYSDAAHLLALLRTRRERPDGRRAGDERDELASLHSITSSARVSSVAGTASPIALAVLRLISSSNLVGNSIGRSPAFAPFNILATYAAARRKASASSLP